MKQEFLSRETAEADWWSPPNGNVLGGRDLQHEAQGTWLGITKQGRVALLTNFKDEGDTEVSQRSRGEIAKRYLCLPPDSAELPEEFARVLLEEEWMQGIGGFSLIFGQLQKDRRTGLRAPLAVISNRTPDVKGVKWIAGEGQQSQAWTCSLSNSRYGDDAWLKVVKAEDLLNKLIEESTTAQESQEDLVDRCFKLLSTDDLPRPKPGQSRTNFSLELRKSIFIPAFVTEGANISVPCRNGETVAQTNETSFGDLYGTQKQSILMVDHAGKVTFIEQTLFDRHPHSSGPRGDVRQFDFEIEGWS